jgi:hypothetical protein
MHPTNKYQSDKVRLHNTIVITRLVPAHHSLYIRNVSIFAERTATKFFLLPMCKTAFQQRRQ